jgi:hypothetical protein
VQPVDAEEMQPAGRLFRRGRQKPPAFHVFQIPERIGRKKILKKIKFF